MPMYRLPGVGMVHIRMANTQKRPAPAPCCARVPASTIYPDAPKDRTWRCRAMSTFLCDWPVEGGTCDAPLCPEHAHQVGPDRHLCPIHFALHRADHPELFE